MRRIPQERRLCVDPKAGCSRSSSSVAPAATLSEFLECVHAAVACHVEPIPSNDERLEMMQTAHDFVTAAASVNRLSGIPPPASISLATSPLPIAGSQRQFHWGV